jgi:hypothetical protein
MLTEMNKIELALFGMQNRAFGPYLAVVHRGWEPAGCSAAKPSRGWERTLSKGLTGAARTRRESWLPTKANCSCCICSVVNR